jgi:hypothetical protein
MKHADKQLEMTSLLSVHFMQFVVTNGVMTTDCNKLWKTKNCWRRLLDILLFFTEDPN